MKEFEVGNLRNTPVALMGLWGAKEWRCKEKQYESG